MRTKKALIVAVVWWLALATQGQAQEAAGVGMALGIEGDATVIKVLLPGAAAAASRSIHVGDRITAVAQEGGKDVPTKGLKLTDVVAQIRGLKGSLVRLTIVPAGKAESEAIVVTLLRGELKELADWGDGALLERGVKAPDIAFLPLGDGPSGRLADHAGKVVVLEFWATWCGPCQAKMTELQRFAETYPGWKGRVVLIGANVIDEKENEIIAHVKKKEWNKTINVRVGPEGMKAYHVNALPTVYVIDQRGNVVDANSSVDIGAVVNRLLDGK